MSASIDAHRPVYHYTCRGWLNDVIPFFDGRRYHVLYDYNPRRSEWTALSDWGHAVSDDLLHWREAPSALLPGPGICDGGGCWTGCVVRDGSRFAALYTGIVDVKTMHQVQCLATSDDMMTWHKHPANPVIPAALKPPEMGQCFRDPCAWREGDWWYAIVGSEQRQKRGGAALLYRSRDLVSWEYMHPLSLGDASLTGHDYECPDFFELGGGHVLLSSRNKTWWQTGAVADHRFAMRRWGACDNSPRAFYAGKTLQDAGGRRVLLGWLPEARPAEQVLAARWAGVLSLPRELRLLDDGTLGIEPHEALAALRRERIDVAPAALDSDRPVRLAPAGDTIELCARFAPSAATEVGLLVRASPDMRQCVRIACDRRRGTLGDGPLALGEDEELVLRVFVDKSVVECFANGRACATFRAYAGADCVHVGAYARGGTARCRVDAWRLAPTQTQIGMTA